MVVSIAGGHGQIALQLTGLLAAEGVAVRSLIRNPDHADDVRSAGGEPLVLDLETASDEAVAEGISGSDVVVFAAGAGPGSGTERKETVDYGAAVRLIEAVRKVQPTGEDAAAGERSGNTGPIRYVMISAVRADPDYEGDDVFAVYQRAKGRADAELSASGLDHLILRPVRLTDEPATGQVRLARDIAELESEYVPRADVAAVLHEAIVSHPGADGTWNLSSGSQSVTAAFT